ncbi:unnamed protein product [Miscanthus lutarioriparius]|uniref:DUF1618 domain-containing protein n=1 Tax=Miscanthus lutarioriparius TaxID=422564 RepID=A0A811SN19_9POAL|nr:unnamed protein product [Miscanthus lutarioriparius]
MSSSSSSRARASESGGRDIPWVLLDRTPRLTDFGGMAHDADVLLELVPPPAVSTVFLDRALLPDAAAWETAPCRVEGADASGHLLLAFPSPRAPGESNLLVCRPVPSSSGGAGKAKGKGHFLPAFPEDVLGLAISPAAPTGIIADHGANTGDAYFVAQVQSAPSSTPVVAVALCFSSDESKWTVREVAGDDRWRDFHANSVVSHDRGVHGDGLLVFVDRNHGLLLFHPRAIASRFVQFPDPPEGGGGGETEEEADASVDSSEGKIIYVVFYDVPDGTMIGLWCLSEENLRWNPHFNLCSDEVFHCDERLLPLQGVRSVGPVDPYRMTRMVFGVRCPADGTPKRRWMETVNSAVQDGKQVGMIALSAVQKGRKYVDKLPGAVQLVGGALGLSHTSALR